MTKQDPLDGADVGQTETVERTVELEPWNVAPDVYFGSDRDSDVEIVDAELVGDDGHEQIKVTFEGDVTKYLPPRWDYARQPRTEEERKQQRRKEWVHRLGKAAAFLIPTALSMAVAVHITNTLAGELSVNGETLAPVNTPEIYGTLALLVIVTAVIIYGLKGGLPRK